MWHVAVVFLFLYVFCLIIDQGREFVTPSIAQAGVDCDRFVDVDAVSR
ncbi:MAG: hypothetical protein GX483_01935 [Actinomycetaceae bacterium]|nr:hypothetical protein [Actinomycetaceae bacterium]